MDLGIAAAVFAVIFVGELPDKSTFASLLLATHGRPALVWVGAAGAFLAHVIIATTVGVAIFAVLPERVVDWLVVAMFLLGAVYAFRSAAKEREEELIVQHEAARHRPVALTAFAVIFVAEWGDLTQVLTVNLAAKYHDPLSVGIGSTLALWAVAALAVAGGRGLLRLIDARRVRRMTGTVLLALAGIVAISAIR